MISSVSHQSSGRSKVRVQGQHLGIRCLRRMEAKSGTWAVVDFTSFCVHFVNYSHAFDCVDLLFVYSTVHYN